MHLDIGIYNTVKANKKSDDWVRTAVHWLNYL